MPSNLKKNMPKNHSDAAKQYRDIGLNPVPIKKDFSKPIREDWGSPIGNDIDKYKFHQIGVCTGAVSGGLEVIDFDLDILDSPEIVWNEWKSKMPKSILEKLLVCRTKSGGYHVIYRCSKIEGNSKLAMKEMPGGKFKTMIETRGQGGYINCPPSDGYEIIYGSFDNIQIIEDWERNAMMIAAKTFDEKGSKKKKNYGNNEYSDPFPEYNSDPDIGIELLEEHGWEIIKEGDLWIEFKRPGKRREGISAGYNLDANFLFVWSTNTDFDTEVPYSNSAILAVLEYDGDYKSAYRELRKKGWGKNSDNKSDSISKYSEKKDIDDNIEDLSFLSRPGEDEEKLIRAVNGEVIMGQSFGWPSLDPYLLYKSNTLNFVLAYEGVGKTFLVLHKLASLATLYGYKFGIACGENEVDTVKRYLIEALSGKRIDYFKNHLKEFELFKDFMYAHFFIFKNNYHYTVEEVLDRGDKLVSMYNLEGMFIDPFSYFKRPQANSYQYTDDLLSVMNIYAHNECTVIMSLHPRSEATRKPTDDEGYLLPPSRYDSIGGNIFANRCDHFFVYHRIKNHKVQKMRYIVDVRVGKVKDYDTGGTETAADESVTLKFQTMNGWRGYFDGRINPIMEFNEGCPIEEEEEEKLSDSEKLPKPGLEEAF